MKIKSLCFAVLIVCGLHGTASASPEASLAGQWEGLIVVRPAEFEVDLRVVISDAGQATGGHLNFPAQSVTQYPLEGLHLESSHVFFQTRDEMGIVSTFEGTISEDGNVIVGDLFESGQRSPFKLVKRSKDLSPPAAAPTVVSSDGRELREAFNQDSGNARLVMILSPTCMVCRMGARLVERHVLEQLADPHLSVYVIWEPTSSRDSLQAAREASALLLDKRIRQFWSSERFAGKAFGEATGFADSPAWDVFLLFGKSRTWTDKAPLPDRFMHNQKKSTTLPKERLLNGETLSYEVAEMLRTNPG